MTEGSISIIVLFCVLVLFVLAYLLGCTIATIGNKIHEKRIEKGQNDPFFIEFNRLSDALYTMQKEYWDLDEKRENALEELRDKVLYKPEEELLHLKQTVRECEENKEKLRPQIEALSKAKRELIEQNEKKYNYYCR